MNLQIAIKKTSLREDGAGKRVSSAAYSDFTEGELEDKKL